MYLERLLQINVATLASLGALLLGMGQRSTSLPLVVMIAAFGSIWLTDVTGYFRLNRWVANVAAIVAVVLAARHLSYFGGDVPIYSIAYVFTYLQIILLFQEKDDRVYWQLVMLSLLQVVVATAFSQGLWFGVLLIFYMLVGLSAMALLFSHRQWTRHRPERKPPPAPRSTPGRRWPLSGQPSVFTGTPSGRSHEGIGREWFGRLAMTGLCTLLLTLLMFFTLPRLGRTAWRGAVLAPKHTVGFSDKVNLGELGEIIESREEVMRVWLTDESTGRPYAVHDELYLRGAILTHYQKGQWEDRTKKGVRTLFTPFGSEKRVLTPFSVRQKITVEPLDRDELFCVWPPVRIGPDDGLEFRRGRLLRRSELRGTRFSYELGTTAFADGRQTPLIPCDDPAEADALLQLPELPELARLAERWIAESGIPNDEPIAQARELTRRFHDPGRFQYSLEGQVRDLSLDPIEDFVAKNPRGHCEYFATALAMMLRSRGIPSRVVVGYRCGALNTVGNFYQVRQLHAHTWVEAYLSSGQIPAARRAGDPPGRWAGGGWLRLEPTPAGAGMLETSPTLTERLGKQFQWLQSLWANYIVEMDRQRQREAIYEPALRAVKNAIQKLRDPDWWGGLAAAIGDALHLPQLGRSPWFWLWAALALLAGLPLLWFGGRRLGRALRRCWSRWTGHTDAAAEKDRPGVEFYHRLEMLLAQHGLVRWAGQTQREFAQDAGSRIAAAAGRARLASLPGQVVEAYYRVRFGGRPLDSTQAEAVEQALGQIAAVELPQPLAASDNLPQ